MRVFSTIHRKLISITVLKTQPFESIKTTSAEPERSSQVGKRELGVDHS